MVSYIPKYKSLGVRAEREPHDLGVELSRFPARVFPFKSVRRPRNTSRKTVRKEQQHDARSEF